MIHVCFVCLGNICRSPTAEGIMLQVVEQAGLSDSIAVDSAGTSAYHIGDRADRRSRETARERGFDLPSISRQFIQSDFSRFDYVLAMDRENLDDLLTLAPDEAARAKVRLFRSFDPASPADADMPDPYYGGARGFENVFDLCEAACQGLLEHLKETHEL